MRIFPHPLILGRRSNRYAPNRKQILRKMIAFKKIVQKFVDICFVRWYYIRAVKSNSLNPHLRC